MDEQHRQFRREHVRLEHRELHRDLDSRRAIIYERIQFRLGGVGRAGCAAGLVRRLDQRWQCPARNQLHGHVSRWRFMVLGSGQRADYQCPLLHLALHEFHADHRDANHHQRGRSSLVLFPVHQDGYYAARRHHCHQQQRDAHHHQRRHPHAQRVGQQRRGQLHAVLQ